MFGSTWAVILGNSSTDYSTKLELFAHRARVSDSAARVISELAPLTAGRMSKRDLGGFVGFFNLKASTASRAVSISEASSLEPVPA